MKKVLRLEEAAMAALGINAGRQYCTPNPALTQSHKTINN